MEYLVVLVNDNLLDPADIMSPEDLGHVLRRGFKETPQKQPRMRENQYQQLLLQVRQKTGSCILNFKQDAYQLSLRFYLLVFIW